MANLQIMVNNFHLRRKELRELNLKVKEIGRDGCNLIKKLEKNEEVNLLNIEGHISDPILMKYIMSALRDTRVEYLKLFLSGLNNDGIKFLADGLQYTNIISLNLSIGEGFLLNEPGMLYNAVQMNDIGDDGVQYLAEGFKNSKVTSLSLICIGFSSNGLRYLADVLNETCIIKLDLHGNFIGNDGVQYLAEKLKNCKVMSLTLSCNFIISRGIRYLADVLNETSITQLNLDFNYIDDEGVQCLAEGLKNSQVISLSLKNNNITSNGIRYLADVLKDTQLTEIILGNHMFNSYPNEIADEGVKYLVDHLSHANISHLNITLNKITNNGVIYLARQLRNTCITHLHLERNIIDNYGIQHLEQSLRDTQIIDVHVEFCNGGLTTDALAENRAMASKIKDNFQKLVVQDTQTYDLEFIAPTEIEHLDAAEYLYIVRITSHYPMIKGHLFDMILMNDCVCYPKIINKINEFVVTVQKKFNTFFNNNILKFVSLFDNSYFVNLIEQCEDMMLPEIVENLLLHRLLYYVDEKGEILHPNIYKMLVKYRMPVFNEQFGQNKKEEIISFFQNHPEIDGGEEIVTWLRSDHSN